MKVEGIFVHGGVPGDICDIKVFKRRKKFWEARIEKIHNIPIGEPNQNVNILELVEDVNGKI